jgi:hypothetical protein
MKKRIFSLISALSIMAMPLTALAEGSQNVNVNADINPASPSYFGLNFDGVSFTGDMGSHVTGTTTLAGEPVYNSNYRVQSTLNFDVYVSGTNLVSDDGKSLSSRRMNVNQYGYMEEYWEEYYDENGEWQQRLMGTGNFYDHEASLQVNNDLTKLYSGSSQNRNHYLQFNLDLTNSNNSYSDNNVLTNLDENTAFSSQVTFTYTGL